jgi:S-adenosylmethionine synthetase
VHDIGYTRPEYHFADESVAVLVTIGRQSPDIAMGVNEAEDHEQGAGDQGLMFGYATDETPELMPSPIMFAHGLCMRMAKLRKEGELPWMRPDGKSQVTVLYEEGKPVRVTTVVMSTQHDGDVAQETIRKELIEKCAKVVIPGEFLSGETIYHVNPTGRFETGGPHGDTGLTGRKIIVDTYGGVGSHGGGCFSGKDPSKVDRSATYMARHIAKNIVAAGLAERCELQLAYAIGVADPVSVLIDTEHTGKVDEARIERAVRDCFPLKPKAIIEYLDLLRPIYTKTAAYGHFGRDEPGFTWEKTDRVDELGKAAGA